MKRTIYTVVNFYKLVIMFCLFQKVNATGPLWKTTTACYGSDVKCSSYSMQCANGETIVLGSLKYGTKTKAHPTCLLGVSDCANTTTTRRCCSYNSSDLFTDFSSDNRTTVVDTCEGQTACTGRAPRLGSTPYSSYVYMQYTCINKTNSISMCKDGVIYGQDLFLLFNLSREYKFPSLNGSSSSECNCGIAARDCNANLQVTFVELQFQRPDSSECSSAYIQDRSLNESFDCNSNAKSNMMKQLLTSSDILSLKQLYMNGSNDRPSYILLHYSDTSSNPLTIQCYPPGIEANIENTCSTTEVTKESKHTSTLSTVSTQSPTSTTLLSTTNISSRQSTSATTSTQSPTSTTLLSTTNVSSRQSTSATTSAQSSTSTTLASTTYISSSSSSIQYSSRSPTHNSTTTYDDSIGQTTVTQPVKASSTPKLFPSAQANPTPTSTFPPLTTTTIYVASSSEMPVAESTSLPSVAASTSPTVSHSGISVDSHSPLQTLSTTPGASTDISSSSDHSGSLPPSGSRSINTSLYPPISKNSSTASTTPENLTKNDDGNDGNKGLVIGLTIAGILIVLIIAAVAMICLCSRLKRKERKSGRNYIQNTNIFYSFPEDYSGAENTQSESLDADRRDATLSTIPRSSQFVSVGNPSPSSTISKLNNPLYLEAYKIKSMLTADAESTGDVDDDLQAGLYPKLSRESYSSDTSEETIDFVNDETFINESSNINDTNMNTNSENGGKSVTFDPSSVYAQVHKEGRTQF